MNEATKIVLEIIGMEREKQKRKWGDSHDDDHTHGEIAEAAAYLASPAPIRVPALAEDWAVDLRKKLEGDRRKQLVVAAALIVSEIERLDRAEWAKENL